MHNRDSISDESPHNWSPAVLNHFVLDGEIAYNLFTLWYANHNASWCLVIPNVKQLFSDI